MSQVGPNGGIILPCLFPCGVPLGVNMCALPLSHTVGLKGRMARHQLEGQHTQSPPIRQHAMGNKQ